MLHNWLQWLKMVTTPEPERIISFFRLRITPISYLACCTLTYINSLNNFFNFVNLMWSCHLVLMNKRKFIHSFILKTYIAPLQETTTQRRSDDRVVAYMCSESIH